MQVTENVTFNLNTDMEAEKTNKQKPDEPNSKQQYSYKLNQNSN